MACEILYLEVGRTLDVLGDGHANDDDTPNSWEEMMMRIVYCVMSTQEEQEKVMKWRKSKWKTPRNQYNCTQKLPLEIHPNPAAIYTTKEANIKLSLCHPINHTAIYP